MKFGIDRLLDEGDLRARLARRRVALLAHPASVTRDLTHSLDAVARLPDLRLTAAFGPQHGLRGDKQDNMVESEDFTDPVHQIPVFSLYGEVRRPTDAMMETFDVLLVDLQDLGCRIYTFITTLRYVLEGIAISGNERTRRPVILRFLPFKRGDVLNVDDPRLELTRYRLLGTGFFRDVTLSLQKGSMRGHVVLHVNVVERNTIVVNNVWMGLSASADTRGENSHVSSFGGVDVAETNLFGSGITLGVATAFSADQQAYALRFLEPSFMNGPWMLERITTMDLVFSATPTCGGMTRVSWTRFAAKRSWDIDAGELPWAWGGI